MKLIYVRKIFDFLFNLFLLVWEICYSLATLPLILLPTSVVVFFLVYSVKFTLFMLSLLCGIRYEVRGIKNILSQPCIIASKHLSPLETFIFIVLFRGGVFILKRELKWIPFIGLHLIASKMIFINRSDGISSIRNIIKSARIRIAENRNIIIFPEGTRAELLQRKKYQVGIAALYNTLSVPVLPVALNTGLFWPKSIFSFRRKCGMAIIEILPPIYPGLSKGDFLQTLERTIEEKSNQLILQANKKTI